MKMSIKPPCPKCKVPLAEVPRHSRSLNDDQYAAVKAGDWYCTTCPDNGRGTTGFCYWTDAEIEANEAALCEAICRS
jgi:hypothetical protein